jgi:hypothetical protein
MACANQVVKITPAQNLILIETAAIVKVFALKARKYRNFRKGILGVPDRLMVILEFTHIHPVRVKPVAGQGRVIRNTVGVDSCF